METNVEHTIYTEVRHAITSKSLGPGAPISENEIARYFQVSRTPVRAALRRLAQDRLVVIIPKRGTFVVEPTAQELDHAWAVRMALERLSVRQAAARLSPEELNALEELTVQELQALKNRDFAVAIEFGNAFHELLARSTGNFWLIESLSKVIAYCSVHYAFYEPVDWDNPISPGEHREILAAIAAGDGEQAVELMTAHLRRQRDQFNMHGQLFPGGPPWRQQAKEGGASDPTTT